MAAAVDGSRQGSTTAALSLRAPPEAAEDNTAAQPASPSPQTRGKVEQAVAEHGCESICSGRLGVAADIPDAAYGTCQCFSPATRLKLAAASSTSGVRQLPKWAFWLIIGAFVLIVVGAFVGGIVAQHVVRQKYKMKSGWSEPGV